VNNLYLYSPGYVKTNDIWCTYIQNLTYLELIENEWTDKSHLGFCISERFDFLKAIELQNRQYGKIDNLVIAAEMWPYGINLLWGDSEGLVTIESFYEYPHRWNIENIKLIGLNTNKKVKENRETFVESLLQIITGQVTYYSESFFKIGIEKQEVGIIRKIIGKFEIARK